MRIFKKKLHGQEGFTLVEMLIVVAIIAILIAVSIPIIRSALDKARHSTDAANERAAKASILVKELSGDFDAAKTYYYDATNGKLQADNADDIKLYGQHSGHKTNGIIAIKIDSSTDAVTMQWTPGTLSGTIAADATICSDKAWNASGH